MGNISSPPPPPKIVFQRRTFISLGEWALNCYTRLWPNNLHTHTHPTRAQFHALIIEQITARTTLFIYLYILYRQQQQQHDI